MSFLPRSALSRAAALRAPWYSRTRLLSTPPNREEPTVTTFSDTSRPRPFKRDLPRIESRWPQVVSFVVLGVAGWALFLTLMTNQEKMSSSVVKQIMRTLRTDEQVHEVLGEAVRMQGEWWLNGDARIHGRISTMQGNIDVSFKVKGTKGAGTLYFTSIRREKGAPFEILRFRIICDDGTVIDVNPI
ncbi:cytochrome oxidase complex assembly protein 1-domain-containing protein [Mycena floridula]|nr:cytochrome oxidase complex assembly protein 1-domain-containing protein [Mycena floridula]